jgi:hypothetical protein
MRYFRARDMILFGIYCPAFGAAMVVYAVIT